MLTQCKNSYYGIENASESDIYVSFQFYHILEYEEYKYSIDALLEVADFIETNSAVRRIGFDTINLVGTYVVPPKDALVFYMQFDKEGYDYDFTRVIISNGSDSIVYNSPYELEAKMEKIRFGAYGYSICESDFIK